MRFNQSEQTRLFLSQSGAKSKPTVTLLCGLVFPRFATVTRTCFESTVFFRKSHLLDNRRNYWRGPKTLQDVTFRIKEPPQFKVILMNSREREVFHGGFTLVNCNNFSRSNRCFSLHVKLMGDHNGFAYQSPLSIQVIRKVPNMQHGRVMSGPGLRNKPLKTGRPTDSTHVSINQELRRPILQMVEKCTTVYQQSNISFCDTQEKRDQNSLLTIGASPQYRLQNNKCSICQDARGKCVSLSKRELINSRIGSCLLNERFVCVVRTTTEYPLRGQVGRELLSS